MQSTNEKLTEVALTMLLKVFREVQCDLFNVMTVGNIETKGNKMAKLTGFLVCEINLKQSPPLELLFVITTLD